jgi:hypothetical protein
MFIFLLPDCLSQFRYMFFSSVQVANRSASAVFTAFLRTFVVAFTELHSVRAALFHSVRLASLPFWLRWWFSMLGSSLDVHFVVPRQFAQIVPALVSDRFVIRFTVAFVDFGVGFI